MNVKIRGAVAKLLIGSTADKLPELVSFLSKRRDELRRAATAQQISGLQMIYLVKQFYQINERDRVTYELASLMEFAYPGDAKLGWFKDRWDKMVR